MADELQESQLFYAACNPTGQDSGESCGGINKQKINAINIRNSAPVDIPAGNSSWIQNDERDDDDDGDGEIVPPHVIIRGRLAGKMAFSVCSGNGRTLKGRDLRQFRNSILRMTGFVEV